MTIRRTILLAVCAAVLAAAGTLLVLRLAGSGGGAAGLFAYVTRDELVVMRHDRVLARVHRESDPADPADYPVVWTHSGSHIVMLGDAGVRQLDASEQQLIAVDAHTGAITRLPCPGCWGLTPVGGDAVLTDQFVVVDLGRGRADLAAAHPPGRAVPTFVAGAPRYVIVARYSQANNGEHLDLLDAAGGLVRDLGDFETNAYMPAAASPDDPLFAVAFRAAPGTCGPFPIHLFRPDADPVMTDQSRVTTTLPSDRHGILVDDLWWGADGHFHALMTTMDCAGSRSTVAPERMWRLDGREWVPERHGPAVMLRPIGDGEAVSLASDGGELYRESKSGRIRVADGVLTVTAPLPGAPVPRAGAIPSFALPAIATAAGTPTTTATDEPTQSPAPAATYQPAGPPAQLLDEVVGRWSTCGAMVDSLTVEPGGRATYAHDAQGGGGTATMRLARDGETLAATVLESSVERLPAGQRSTVRLADHDEMVIERGGDADRPGWYLFRWGTGTHNAPDSACGG